MSVIISTLPLDRRAEGGNTSDATRRHSSTWGNPDRMNSSMPRRQYAASSAVTCLGSPTIAVPRLTRTFEIPFQRRGDRSRSSARSCACWPTIGVPAKTACRCATTRSSTRDISSSAASQASASVARTTRCVRSPNTGRRPLAPRRRPHTVQQLGDLVERLDPRQVHFGAGRREFERPRRGAADVEPRGARHRSGRHDRALQPHGAPLEHHGLRLRPERAQGGDELFALLVALVVVDGDAEPLEVTLDPAGHHVDVEPPAADLIERRRHLGEQAGRDESRPDRHQEPDASRVTAASAVAVVHVSASGAVSPKSPFANRVGIRSE